MARQPADQVGHLDAVQYAQDHRDSIRRIISRRLGTRLHRIFSTTDIEHSLLRVLLEKSQPSQSLADEEIRRLVIVISLRLVRAKLRHEHSSRWDLQFDGQEPQAGANSDPAEQAAAREFVETASVSAGDDWPLVEARLDGCTFPELVDRFAAQPDALRMRFQRALKRIAERMEGGPEHE